MSASRMREVLRLVAAAAAVVLAVDFASPAHAQDCNGALNISIPSPKAIPPTGPYLNVGDSTTVTLNLGSGTISGGMQQITLRRLRYELDCNHLFALGVPCTDQGTIMSYDFTQTVASGGALVQCQGRTWTATAGSSANEVIFTPDTPIVLPPEQSASPTLNNCFISFQVKLESLEPSSGPNSDDTPEKVEVVAGFSTVLSGGHADAECDNGGASGVSQSSGIFTCPSCTVDECNQGCDTTSGQCTPQTSTPCTDSDGNTCTTAGCEVSTTNADLGVCVQTHMFASNSTPCADSDGNACTTAGCNGQGVCDQNHMTKTCPAADQCNGGCDATSGQCTPKTSTPCTDTDGNVCTIAGCEVSPTNSELGVCVQNHMFASDSTPCPDTDNDACTTAGCNGQGVCDQSHMQCVKALGCRVTGGGTVDACGTGDSGCDPNTPGSCAPDTCASPALEATHGGQVGASIGVATAFTADSACIAGEWTHVRHIRPRLFGNFHARSFDSLMCACLSCPENPDVQGVPGPLCNPDDRICGPEPRRAPANKTRLPGAGDYALTNGRRESRSVVFRVDVEDRSEPGGTNGPPPPDRYRIRIWFVDPDTSDGLTLRREVACADPTTEELTATSASVPTPDIDDGGDLIRGNQQIHPPLKKTCP